MRKFVYQYKQYNPNRWRVLLHSPTKVICIGYITKVNSCGTQFNQ